MDTINVENKFSLFQDLWSPKIVAELNGQYVKLAKIKGEFEWHKHDKEDELFFVVKGILTMTLEDKTLKLNAGECLVIPKGVMHKPSAVDECWIMLFEPTETLNTGNKDSTRTVRNLEWI